MPDECEWCPVCLLATPRPRWRNPGGEAGSGGWRAWRAIIGMLAESGQQQGRGHRPACSAWPLLTCCHSPTTGPRPGRYSSPVSLVYVDPSSRLCPQARSDCPAVEPAGQFPGLQGRSAAELLQNVMNCRPANETATSARRHDQLAAAVQGSKGSAHSRCSGLYWIHCSVLCLPRNKTPCANKSAGFTLSLIFLLCCRSRESWLGRAEQDRCC